MSEPGKIDLLIEARWVIPVEPHGVVLEHHAVAVAGGRIVALLPIAEARARYAARETCRLTEHVLIPGLINAHTHNPMTLMRGIADDLPLMTWLKDHIWPAEARAMSAEFVHDGVELAIAEMLRGGTTCCNENYFFPDAQAATYRRHGFRALVGLPVIEFPSAWAHSRDEYFDKALAVHDEYRGDALIGTCWVVIDRDGLRRVRAWLIACWIIVSACSSRPRSSRLAPARNSTPSQKPVRKTSARPKHHSTT